LRLSYPTNDTPVFTCPSVSTSDYDWSRKSAGERIFLKLVNIGLIIFVLYGFLVCYAHRWILWDDLTYSFVWQVLKSLGILALFPLIVGPVMLLFAWRHGHSRSGYPEHRFFRKWASIFRRPTKGGGRASFFVEDVESFILQRSLFCQEFIYLAKVRFNRKWAFRRGEERFILRVPDEAKLQPFLNWARENQIAINFEPEIDSQRWS
jgi:hypothetical protein